MTITERIELLLKFNEGSEIQDNVVSLTKIAKKMNDLTSRHLVNIILSVAEQIVADYIQHAIIYKEDYPEWLADLHPDIIKEYKIK